MLLVLLHHHYYHHQQQDIITVQATALTKERNADAASLRRFAEERTANEAM